MDKEKHGRKNFYRKLAGAIAIVSLLSLLLTGFTFENYFIIGAIWTTLFWIIYKENEQRSYAIWTALSIILMAIGAYGLFMQ